MLQASCALHHDRLTPPIQPSPPIEPINIFLPTSVRLPVPRIHRLWITHCSIGMACCMHQAAEVLSNMRVRGTMIRRSGNRVLTDHARLVPFDRQLSPGSLEAGAETIRDDDCGGGNRNRTTRMPIPTRRMSDSADAPTPLPPPSPKRHQQTPNSRQAREWQVEMRFREAGCS